MNLPFRASGRNSKIVAESFLVKIIDKHYADKWKQLAVSNAANKRFRSRLALVVEEMKILLVY